MLVMFVAAASSARSQEVGRTEPTVEESKFLEAEFFGSTFFRSASYVLETSHSINTTTRV
jgi:hypothetical protein